MHQLTVSTVIPTCRRPALLKAALATAVRECEPGDEVIVVDDGNQAEVEAVVDAFGSSVQYMTTPHAGAGVARNAGIRAASGDLVAFLDDDDEWMLGKLSWQRAVMEAFPQVLFLFSDFGIIDAFGLRKDGGGLASWDRHFLRPWMSTLRNGLAAEMIPNLPVSVPPFRLHIGRLYEDFIWSWCIFTSTLVVRREAAGEALRFAEDVPTYEDLECYARLANQGTAAFMSCATAWQGQHSGRHLSNASAMERSEAAMKVTSRVWGSDADYLRNHRHEYEAVMDTHRTRKVRSLLAAGRRHHARRELAAFYQKPRGYAGYSALTYVPGGLMSCGASARQLYLQMRHRPRHPAS